MSDKEYDIYRDSPVRLLGYANEVGESCRGLVHVNVVRASYAVASLYGLADVFSKRKMSYELQYKSEEDKNNAVFSATVDALIWQGLSSVIIPGIAVNRICAFSRYVLRHTTKLSPLPIAWLAVAAGIASIPIIYQPIDHFVDYAMDGTIRKVLPKSSPIQKT